MDAPGALQLAEWRRQVTELYTLARAGAGQPAWEAWRSGKERLYREHPQSPVPQQRRASHSFRCFPYDASMRVLADATAVVPSRIEGGADVPGMTRVCSLRFTLADRVCELGAFWLDGYAGGLFVPFVDATSGTDTYGGGRYALDTAKGADLGVQEGRLVIDFNFAYAPSCAHDPRWQCPLAPSTNRLPVAVRAGEIG